jgi:glycosyltransferase involved in cell wall biosynthesis
VSLAVYLPEPTAAATRPPHRLLHVVTSSDFGGTETAVRELALRLNRAEFAVRVCSLRPGGRVAAEIAAGGVPVVSLDMAEQPRLPELLRGVRRLARLIDEAEIELVHSFLYRANVVARLGARLSRRRPPVISSQRSLGPTGARFSAIASRWTRRLCHRVVAVSQAVRREVVRHEGLEPAQVAVIPNGVDAGRFESCRRGGRTDALGLTGAAVVVGGVGRLAPEKGFADLLRALALTRRTTAAIALVLVGDGPERAALRTLADHLGLADAVHFLGTRGDLREVYGGLDILALPSLEEGSPNVLLEAMAAGLPVVATSVGGVPEIVQDGRTGILVPPAAPGALAQALSSLAADGAGRRRLGAEGQRRVRAEFDIGVTVARHAALYREVLGR